MHEVYDDVLLPKCLKHPDRHHEGALWVMNTIRSLNPGWWRKLSQRYDEVYSRVGVFMPAREENERLRGANLFLLDIKTRFGR